MDKSKCMIRSIDNNKSDNNDNSNNNSSNLFLEILGNVCIVITFPQ